MASASSLLHTIILLGALQGIISGCVLHFSRYQHPASQVLAVTLWPLSLSSLNIFLNYTGIYYWNTTTTMIHALLPMVILKLDSAALDRLVGTYKWVEDTTRSIIIYRRGDRLYADLSNKTGMNMPMLAQTETRFYLPVVRRIPTYIEFKIESGRVTGMYWIQDRRYEGKRVD